MFFRDFQARLVLELEKFSKKKISFPKRHKQAFFIYFLAFALTAVEAVTRFLKRSTRPAVSRTLSLPV